MKRASRRKLALQRAAAEAPTQPASMQPAPTQPAPMQSAPMLMRRLEKRVNFHWTIRLVVLRLREGPPPPGRVSMWLNLTDHEVLRVLRMIR